MAKSTWKISLLIIKHKDKKQIWLSDDEIHLFNTNYKFSVDESQLCYLLGFAFPLRALESVNQSANWKIKWKWKWREPVWTSKTIKFCTCLTINSVSVNSDLEIIWNIYKYYSQRSWVYGTLFKEQSKA
jgi:hypothetical protein